MTWGPRRFSYLRLNDVSDEVDDDVLYLDPLTTLVAYPSFERHITKMLPQLAARGLHIAIGDVDGLREYVSQQRSTDPANFGHLAGNACMRTIGRLTRAWAGDELATAEFQLCGTFGGDEVTVASTGITHVQFADKIHRLCQTIKESAPRSCSFALATLKDRTVTAETAADAYCRFLSTVDARLFHEKERARLDGAHLNGTVTDHGMLNLLCQDLAGYRELAGDES